MQINEIIHNTVEEIYVAITDNALCFRNLCKIIRLSINTHFACPGAIEEYVNDVFIEMNGIDKACIL